MARRKCPVCGLYLGKKAHTGAIHDRLMANRKRVRRRLAGRPGGLRKRLGL